MTLIACEAGARGFIGWLNPRPYGPWLHVLRENNGRVVSNVGHVNILYLWAGSGLATERSSVQARKSLDG